jgi:hypothetical protein
MPDEKDHKGWDDRDSQDQTKEQYGNEDSRGEVRRTWHQAREDCRRSNDDYDKNLRKGWKR